MIDFFEFSNEMLCLADHRGYFTRLNRAWTAILGWSVDELLSCPYLDFVHPDDVEATIREANLLLLGGYETISFENRYRCQDGSYRWLAWYAKLEPGSGQLVAAARDITDQKLQAEALRQSEAELKQSQEELLLALDAARMGTWNFNLSTKSVAWSKTAEAMLGYGSGGFSGRFDAFLAAVHPDDRAGITESIAARVQNRTDQQPAHQFRVVWPDGRIHWLESKGRPYFDAEGKPFRVIGVCMDITERKAAEEALRDSEERFRAIFSQANVGIATADLSGRFQMVNDKYCEIVGYSREELLTRTYQEITHPDDLQACMTLIERAMTEKASFTTEKRYVRKDGKHIWANTAISSVQDHQEKPIYAVGVVQDISDRKRAEEAILAKQELLKQLYESQENERRLVAFELHDGPIQYATAAMMHLDAYKESLPEPPPELELAWYLLRKTMQESRRLMNGIRPPVLDEAGLVSAVEQLIKTEAAELPEVEFIHTPEFGRFAPTLESAIYRIVQEGLTNARKHSQSDKVRITLGRHDGHVRLEIQDWGVGFEPTDVAQHRGGLKGFAERVRLAGGVLKIDSTPGKGTKIVVELPVLQAV